MNLQKIKEMEDLKTKLKNVSTPYQNELLHLKSEVFKAAQYDFTNFFEKQGFKIDTKSNNEGKTIVASYGDFSINLTIPQIENTYVGALSIFNLKVKEEYTVSLNEAGHKSGVSVSFSSGREKNEEEKFKEEIERINKSIEGAKKAHENLKENGLTFRYYKQKQSYDERSQEYKSFKEILEILFKE